MGHFMFLMFSYFQKNEKIALLHFKRKRKKLIYLNSHRYYGGQLSLLPKNFWTKIKCIGTTRLVSSQNALYSPLERESLRDETKVRLRKRLRVQPLL